VTGKEDSSPPCGAALQFQNGIVGIHPAVFVRVASKGLAGYGTWKSAQRAENNGFAKCLFVRKSAVRAERVQGRF
jgi:hypothetical protein